MTALNSHLCLYFLWSASNKQNVAYLITFIFDAYNISAATKCIRKTLQRANILSNKLIILEHSKQSKTRFDNKQIKFKQFIYMCE